MSSFLRSTSGPLRAPRFTQSVRPGFSALELFAQLHSQGISLPPNFRTELWRLRLESDPELLAEALYAFASRAERQGQPALAVVAYSFLAEVAELPADIVERVAPSRRLAQSRLEVLGGGGPLGARAEVFFSHFVKDVSDPGLLLGMGVAGGAFRTIRLLALGELGVATGFSPLASRFLANAAGFAVEAPAFVMTTRGVHAALGMAESPTHGSLGREMLSAYLFLGAMKVSGGVADRLHRRLIGAPKSLSPSQGLSSLLFPQAGMLGGIILSHRVEEAMGLRPSQGFAALLGESLATLVHLNVSGRIFHRLTGPGFRHWESAMDSHAESLARPLFPPRLSLSALTLAPVLATKLSPGELSGMSPTTESGRITVSVESSKTDDVMNLSEQPMQDVLDRFTRLWNSRADAAPEVEFGTEFGKRIADWGYDWQEGKMREYGADFPRLRALHKTILEGRAISSGDGLYLDALIQRSEKEMNDFELSRQLLARIVVLSRQTRPQSAGAEDRSVDRVLHDLSHRPQFLQVFILAGNDLRSGVPLEDFHLQHFNPKGGFTLGQTIHEAVVGASVESPAMVARVEKKLQLKGLEDLHLVQGSEAARGLGDIVANFLTNAWRYRRSDDLVVRVETTALTDGAMRISVSDDGIGIEPGNIASLGSHGFRESRVQLSNSHGFGLASVISNLRRLDWGALWVKSRVGEGTEFRFEIPAGQLISSEKLSSLDQSVSIERMEQGGEASLETNLNAGFVVPAVSLNLAIRQLLREVPSGPSAVLDYRRREILDRLLGGGRQLEGLQVYRRRP